MANFWEAFNKIKVAYQYYIAFFLSIPSFLSIIYEKYISPSFLIAYIPTLSRFVVIVVVIGLPVLWLLSIYHYEKKPNRPKYELSKMDMEVNPLFMDLVQAMSLMAQDENEKAVEILSKWNPEQETTS